MVLLTHFWCCIFGPLPLNSFVPKWEERRKKVYLEGKGRIETVQKSTCRTEKKRPSLTPCTCWTCPVKRFFCLLFFL
ncbi:hypothetical protein BC939DRAFT_469953 [Gamsiella multidivaricata]|uniref:uncharacterized protein n=1 Tax=Gamsiella multidivaricata TaxID=101098 RepID=UPI00221FDAF6|nr:uncharacterized protein BC939DRAFT_469953 [Gamsiella multidivaricata]KAI7816208.1 hypothetical protein BC939DRAFT_469953 [Gamsiella multidivaricata]